MWLYFRRFAAADPPISPRSGARESGPATATPGPSPDRSPTPAHRLRPALLVPDRTALGRSVRSPGDRRSRDRGPLASPGVAALLDLTEPSTAWPAPHPGTHACGDPPDGPGEPGLGGDLDRGCAPGPGHQGQPNDGPVLSARSTPPSPVPPLAHLPPNAGAPHLGVRPVYGADAHLAHPLRPRGGEPRPAAPGALERDPSSDPGLGLVADPRSDALGRASVLSHSGPGPLLRRRFRARGGGDRDHDGAVPGAGPPGERDRGAAYKREIESPPDPEQRGDEIEAHLLQFRNPSRSAETFGIEDIIDPRQTRAYVHRFLELAYETLSSQLGVKTKAASAPSARCSSDVRPENVMLLSLEWETGVEPATLCLGSMISGRCGDWVPAGWPAAHLLMRDYSGAFRDAVRTGGRGCRRASDRRGRRRGGARRPGRCGR